MPSPRVLLVELEGEVARHLTQKLADLGVEVGSASAKNAVKRLADEVPDLLIVSERLSRGTGRALVDRVLRMEALSTLQVVLVAAADADMALLEAHRAGPTPADAYVRRGPHVTAEAFADFVLEAAQGLLTNPLPEANAGDFVDVERSESGLHDKVDPLEAVINDLGGYRVLRRLRDEDGGAVFACKDAELGRPVAIKLMAPQRPGEPPDERLQRFQRERRILALLHSPYVVAVYGAGTHKDTPYLVRELIDGESLAEQVARTGPLDVTTALLRVCEAALGLKAAAAAGVIHRDVRPENIHVVDGHAKIARFGMGRRDDPDEARITRSGLQLPDVTYVAPERLRGQEDVRGDIYALGVTLHMLIAGAPPFSKPSPLDVVTGKYVERPIPLDVARPGTPAPVAALVRRMMAEDPAARPQSYDDVLVLIDEATRALGQSQAPRPVDIDEPEAVQGTLRLMSVVEIAQSLELARKTATVTLPSAEEGDGKLAFVEGQLVYAALSGLLGDEAFFALVARRRGAFKVQYEAHALEPNISTPVTALILEAARRADDASRPPGDAAPAEEDQEAALEDALAAVEPAFFEFPGEQPPAPKRAPEVSVSASAPARRPARQVHPALGFVAIAAGAALAVFVGLQVPGSVEPPDPADAALAALLAKQHAQLRDARAKLADLEPRLAAYDAEHATRTSAEEEADRRAVELEATLEEALKAELAASQLTARLSDDEPAVILELGERALFAGDGDDVTNDGKAILARVAEVLKPLGDVTLRVEGHTDDSEPRGRHRNNWGLSGARAMSVVRILGEQGFTAERVKAVARADTEPLSPNRNAKGRARNRRIELHVAAPPLAPVPPAPPAP